MNNKMKIALFLAATMMMGSANAFAAGPSTVPQGKLTAAVTANSESPPVSVNDQIDKLAKGLKPGEVMAYYVKDKASNPLDQVSFTGKGFVLNNYNDYLKKAKETNAPSLAKPDDLPKGYTFKGGILYLKHPGKTSDLYKELEKELKGEAAKGGKAVYSKIIKVSEADHSVLDFQKGKATLSIAASHVYPSEPIGGTPVPFKNPNEKTETVMINGVECTYTTNSKGIDHLDWVDEENQIRYSIWADNVKADVISFAEKMLGE